MLQRQGLYPAPKGASDILGMEIAGTVVAVGGDVTRFKIGDPVCALVGGGAYAEFCVAPEATTLPVPQGLGMIEAAALPEAVFTVWHNVFERAALKPGEWLLVHGGTSGIGTTAIQIGAALGAKVMVTVGSAEKVRAAEALGALRAVNYREEDFVEAVRELRPAVMAQTSFSTWSAATISNAISRPRRSKAASCRSLSSRAPRSRSISCG